MTEAAVHTFEGPTMDVALKIWRVDENGERELKTYEVEVKPWGVRELSIRDPGGNILRIGQNQGNPAEAEKFTDAEEVPS